MGGPESAPGLPVVVALFGPTGVGKTAVGARVAETLGVRVISCDSLQVYRGLPILTNQPQAVDGRHAEALVGVAGPEEEWTAAVYASRAVPLIEQDLATTGWAFISGGTGLYLRAALAPLAMAPPADAALRASLEERLRLEGPERLHSELAERDPTAAARIHPRNARRVVRALEISMGEPGGAFSERDELWKPRYRHPTLLVGLTMDRHELWERIDRRAREMVQRGAVEEVRHNRMVLQPGKGAAKAIGYQEIVALLDGEATEQQTIDRIAQATRRYAKRQLTWMRRLEDAVIMDATGREPDDLARAVVDLAVGMKAGFDQERSDDAVR